jgi:hypothetical protein
LFNFAHIKFGLIGFGVGAVLSTGFFWAVSGFGSVGYGAGVDRAVYESAVSDVERLGAEVERLRAVSAGLAEYIASARGICEELVGEASAVGAGTARAVEISKKIREKLILLEDWYNQSGGYLGGLGYYGGGSVDSVE